MILVLTIAVATPNPVMAQDQANSPKPYLLGVEDVLFISVWKEPELTLNVTVRPDGKISFPLVGDIQAAGRSATELGDGLKEKLAVYIREPVVTVLVEQINSFKVSVLGEVNAQGVLTLRSQTRFLEALALAGGLTEFADKNDILLIRVVDDREIRLEIDYKKLLGGSSPEMNIFLRPGDTIIVR